MIASSRLPPEEIVVKMWQDEVNEHLANLHPHEIIVGIIKPAVEQVISDFEDAITVLDEKAEQEQIKMHRNLIIFWKGVQRKIKLAR